MATDDTPGVHFNDSTAGGAAGRLIRQKDWSATPLGSREAWPRSLESYLSMILELPTAAIIFWGPNNVQLYNDGYAVIMGPRHPRYLGATFAECWPEAYDTIHPWMERVLLKGETVSVNRTLVPLTRHGFTEEAYFTFSFTPLHDDAGRIGGILQLVTEVTSAVLGERRAATLNELSSQTTLGKTMEEVAALAAEVMGRYAADVPFAAIYTVDASEPERFVLSGSTGVPEGRPPFSEAVDLKAAGALKAADAGGFPELARAVRERKSVSAEGVVVSPIAAADQNTIVAVLVAGISPRLELDGHYRGFLTLVSGQLATLLAAARAYDDERKRAEAQASIDRAKTEFFSNVSHEFRTPLTLILGPLEDALGDASKPVRGEALEAVHRNALRLLRLVNNLLDFARLEADRLEPSFEATDLPLLTAGLAGSFHSLVESVGLKLRIDCSALSAPAYVDRAQWEKIVLNLISNAFKFTFEGEIAVRLHEADGGIHLTVSDTGTGIPAHELPRIFERFHRVEGARGRSFEGTGIGLALVRELVKSHGGTVRADSAVGKGTTFVVTIPRGADHLPKPTVTTGHPVAGGGTATASYVAEATQWRQKSTETKAAPAAVSGAHILVADDNPDMREYIVRLLSTRWSVKVVEDGQAALEAAREDPPELVVSDVMMPRLDGVGLLRALRAEARTSTIPIILLSARAGEDAVVAGLDTGADDYLVKPFSARELMSRVATHLEMSRARKAAADAARELADTRAALLDDLKRKHAELEAFSYSVSHDLRAPLRSIDGFSMALLEDYAAELPAKAQDYLSRVRAAAGRMGNLIDDLLELSRVDRAQLRREPVDLSRLARRIGEVLAKAEPDRNVALAVRDGLVADADARVCQILLENLLGNAWKFTKKKPEPRIEMGAVDKDGQTAFFIKDNGSGFDAAYAGTLFAPFRRLHSDAEFPGTGIGLATVRRIVERHGGRAWAEGEIGVGATLYWTLPAPR